MSLSTDSEKTPQPQQFKDFDFFESDQEDVINGQKLPAVKSELPTKLNRKPNVKDRNRHIHNGRLKRGRKSAEKDSSMCSSSDSESKPFETKVSDCGERDTYYVSQTKKKTDILGQVMIHIPSGKSCQNENDSSSSVTDVSPLQTPDASPRPTSFSSHKIGKRLAKKSQKPDHETVIVNKNIVREDKRLRAQSETLSVEDLLYRSEGISVTGSEEDADEEQRKRVQRRKKNSYRELHHRMEASARHHRQRLLDVAAQNSMDISQLLEVVLEMEREAKLRKAMPRYNAPSVVGLSPIGCTHRKNMSFSTEQVRNIDIENERLLRRLTQLCENSKKGRPSSASSVRSSTSSCLTNSITRSSRHPATTLGTRGQTYPRPRLYHSATNRIRDQQRIERENLAFLKRLQEARASSSLRRDVLLRDYERRTGRVVESIQPNKTKTSGYTEQLKQNGKPVWQDSW